MNSNTPLTKVETKCGFPCLCCGAANYEDAADKCDGSPDHYGCCADNLNKLTDNETKILE